MDTKEPELKDGIFYTGNKGEFSWKYLENTHTLGQNPIDLSISYDHALIPYNTQ